MTKVYKVKNVYGGEEKDLDLQAWFEYYQENTGIFWAILRQKVRLMRYTIEYSQDLDDLMQESIERVCRKLQGKSIPYAYRHTTFGLEARAAIKAYIWKTNKFKGMPGKGIPEAVEGEKIDPAYAGEGERVMVTSDNYLAVDQKIDITACLDKAEQKIVSLLLANYKKTEVADIMKMSRQGIYWKLSIIRKKLEAAGLKPAV